MNDNWWISFTGVLQDKNDQKNDIGLYLTEISDLSDVLKLGLLTNHWTPPRNYKFPVYHAQNRSRHFNMEWLRTYQWLVYSPSAGGAFCAPCVLFGTQVGSWSGVYFDWSWKGIIPHSWLWWITFYKIVTSPFQIGHNSGKLDKLYRSPLTNWISATTKLLEHQNRSAFHKQAMAFANGFKSAQKTEHVHQQVYIIDILKKK